MRITKKTVAAGAVLFLAVLAVLIINSGLLGLWSKGIACIANNTDEYGTSAGGAFQGEYSVTIDLSNLEGNTGKVLYSDKTHKIYVSWLDNNQGNAPGEYRILFKSEGEYSLKGASLISGIQHATVDDNSFTQILTAKMTARYRGKTYASREFSTSGLNYKDGDEFGFYIFPQEAYQQKEVAFNETGKVVLTISNLYENVWNRR
ncbi:hypothetical protein CLHUN_37190 [Ruminiclostridium hungatei]|uniref:Uncharacterized protein n=1 Tax=Ruminiclostridium hungatei TaxID=48256 RepID=A0A1V4SET2_RUMHU|nr:hypothetical protein [Ruminiclostridium hungatei]OPX42422.1 hypothetical protein CLHUN_37190 [Ruminiclostridium hungatei]